MGSCNKQCAVSMAHGTVLHYFNTGNQNKCLNTYLYNYVMDRPCVQTITVVKTNVLKIKCTFCSSVISIENCVSWHLLIMCHISKRLKTPDSETTPVQFQSHIKSSPLAQTVPDESNSWEYNDYAPALTRDCATRPGTHCTLGILRAPDSLLHLQQRQSISLFQKL